MTCHLLDTDTLSHVAREPSGTVARRIAVVGEEAVATTPIGPNDLWIAAHALAEEHIVVTGNVRDLRRVAGLGVEDWR